jgi:hypothetical protein
LDPSREPLCPFSQSTLNAKTADISDVQQDYSVGLSNYFEKPSKHSIVLSILAKAELQYRDKVSSRS